MHKTENILSLRYSFPKKYNMLNYFQALYLCACLVAYFLTPLASYAQKEKIAPATAQIAQGDLYFHNYSPQQAIAAYDSVGFMPYYEIASLWVEAQLKKAHALQSMFRSGEARQVYAQIYARQLQISGSDFYSLGLSWLAKAHYHQIYQQKDSIEIAVKEADAAMAKLADVESHFHKKAFYNYIKQNLYPEVTDFQLRKTITLTALSYADRVKNENYLLRLVLYERWLSLAVNTEEVPELEKIIRALNRLVKNPYFQNYPRLEAGFRVRNMMVVGYTQDSAAFVKSAEVALGFIKSKNLLETPAYGDYLHWQALIWKDVRVKYVLAKSMYENIIALANKNPEAVSPHILLDSYINVGYILLDYKEDTSQFYNGLKYMEKAWQMCVADKYKNLKWGEFPDLAQADSRIMTLRQCLLTLQGLVYGYNRAYVQDKKEIYKTALFNALRATETLLFNSVKNSPSEVQRATLVREIEEFFTRKVAIYKNLYEQNPSLELLNELWQIAQQCNARSSRYRLSEEKALKAAKVEEKLAQELLKLKAEQQKNVLDLSIAQKNQDKTFLANTAQRNNELEVKISDLDKIIKRKYPQYERLQGELDWVKIEQVRPLLKNSALIIHYCSRLENYQILVSSDTVIFYNTYTDRDKVGKKLIDSLNNFLCNPPQEALVEAVYREQFERLLLRAKDSFFRQMAYLKKQNIQNVIIVPDELTGSLPYEVLLTTGNNVKKSYKDWAWAVKQFNFQYLPSLSFWLQSRQSSENNHSNGKLLAFAPTYQNGVKNELRAKPIQQLRKNLAELSGAKKELENLKTYYYGDYYIGSEANEALYKSKTKETYSIFHFAMHGLLDEELADLSSLAFSESVDTTEDNFLSAYEIAELQQYAQLVVLSACETGKGKRKTGEGVMSLAQYFLYGGAPAVVATRWQVNDQTTAFIMQNFYKNIYENKTIKAALREAQLSYISQSQGQGGHPFYWSAFFNVGDTDKSVYLAHKNWAIKYYLIFAGGLLLLTGGFWWKYRKREK